jgi:16S rRNA (uracil1498-N3)-methyltransferase
VALPRFLASDLDPASGSASLSPDETHHLTHVMRLRFGDEIAVFDGDGREYRARVERVSREGAHLLLVEELEAAPEPGVRLTLAQAVLKGDRMDDVVRDAAMMGVAAVEPVLSEHTIVRPAALEDGRAADRWRRVAIASVKQCRRAVLPIIGAGTPFMDWIAEDESPMRILLVEPRAAVSPLTSRALRDEPPPRAATLLVGPEGGWSAAEVERATAAGWIPLTLGGRTFRADAAPIIAISVLQAFWADL